MGLSPEVGNILQAALDQLEPLLKSVGKSLPVHEAISKVTSAFNKAVNRRYFLKTEQGPNRTVRRVESRRDSLEEELNLLRRRRERAEADVRHVVEKIADALGYATEQAPVLEHVRSKLERIRQLAVETNRLPEISIELAELTSGLKRFLNAQPGDGSTVEAGGSLAHTAPLAEQPMPDRFATREQREVAIKRAAEEVGGPTKLASSFTVDYHDLRKWARKRNLAKHHSVKQERIENGLLPFCPALAVDRH